MNILYLNNEMTVGGVAKCILNLSKELIKDNKIFIASKEKGALLEEFKKLGIKNYPLIDVQSKLPHNIIINIIRIVRLVKKEQIDIIHSHHRMTTLIAKIVARITGVRVIHTQHLCIEDKFKLTNLALRNIQTITVSEAAKRILVEKSKLDSEKIVTIYNTIETESINKEVDKRLLRLKEDGYFIVAQISRAFDYKGVYDFIEIAKKTINVNKKLRFVFIGDGPELENMKRVINDNKLEEYVFLLGSKDNVIEHLKYINILLLCSYIEGLPLAPIEAFSQRVPVIATDIDGTNEEIINGYNGYLLKCKDTLGISKKIIELYNNNEEIEIMKKNSYTDYILRFNKEKYLSKHVDIYNRIIGR